MIHSPGQIATGLRLAGVPDDAVTALVAAALAASGGAPMYHLSAGVPGAGNWCGLWGVNTDRTVIPGGTVPDDLAGQCELARWLIETTGGYDWCDAYRSGGYRHWLDVAAPAASRSYDPGTTSRPVAAHQLPGALDAFRRRAAAAHVDVRHALNQRRR